jgi:hypothetical protein
MKGLLLAPLALALPATLVGCEAKIALPPSNMTAWLDAPATLGEGKQSVEASTSATGELFAPGVYAASVRYTRALSASVDIGVAPMVLFVGDEPLGGGGGKGSIDGYRAGDRFAYGADAQIKVNPFATKHLALFGSLGGAHGRYATFLSTAGGVSLGYENDYVVPFAALLVYGSVPLASEAFTYRSAPSAAPKILEATATWGAFASAGIAVKASEHVTLKFTMNVGRARSETDTFSLTGGASALGVTF